MYFARCQPDCSALFVGLGPRLRLQQLVRFDPQHPGYPHERVDGCVRHAALDVADERPTSPGSVGEIGLGHPQGEPQLSDVVPQRRPDAPQRIFKGLESCHEPSANPPGIRVLEGWASCICHVSPAAATAQPGNQGFDFHRREERRRVRRRPLAELPGVPAEVLAPQRSPGLAPRRRAGPQKLAFVPESLNLAGLGG